VGGIPAKGKISPDSLPGAALVLALEDGSKYFALTKNGIEIKGDVKIVEGSLTLEKDGLTLNKGDIKLDMGNVTLSQGNVILEQGSLIE
jgi:lipopolysaccharide export system protein LptA